MTGLWKKGDWAAFFGLFSNNLTNLLTMIALLTLVVGIPKDIVFGQVAPAFGLAVCCASVFYVIFAKQLAKKTGRDDIVALPSGPSAPSIFTVTFLVLLPVYQETQDYKFALSIGLVWGFVEGMMLFFGAFMGDFLRRVVPRTVLLSCLAGLGLLLLAMNPMLQAFHTPVVAFVVLVLIFINWFGRSPMFKKIPTGLLLLIVGSSLAWVFGLQDPSAIGTALHSAGFNPPTPHINDFIDGIRHAGPYLASAVPLALANYVFDLENIESAHAAGDPYPTRRVMLANGGSSMFGALMGNPFPVTVYVGHTAYKEMGAGIGYTLATGLVMLLVCMFGLGAFLLSLIPMAAIAPILIFIGIVTANQVVRETPKLEVPVIFVCLFPWIGAWALTLANNVLKSAGTNAGTIGWDILQKAGVDYTGLYHLGSGAPLSSLLWGCIAIFAITNNPKNGAIAAVIAAILSFFGIIHQHVPVFGGEAPLMFAMSYLMVAGLLFLKHVLNKKDVE
ncbi:xanthine permease [Mannheimia sp. AT1]|uniref:Xanthine permease n=1 Tax=Mannheimia cairinae TaxID=3025936 RepID=A0ABT5MQL8_9PAST|nr:xanthine permease [Mannheimia cairinae]MDD0824282.1 xanthine permease [Mannheimia cairinae]MDD0826595.1 xanthine permease [Mannheimia cairinae]